MAQTSLLANFVSAIAPLIVFAVGFELCSTPKYAVVIDRSALLVHRPSVYQGEDAIFIAAGAASGWNHTFLQHQSL